MPSTQTDIPAEKLVLPCALAAVGASLVTYLLCKRACPGAAFAAARRNEGGNNNNKTTSSTVAGQKETQSNKIYETDTSAEQYMEFHFTPSAKLFEPYNADMKVREAFEFTTRVAQKFDKFRPAKMGRVLDLGCAVGMSSFELTKSFDEVVGIDLSEAFIKAAKRVATERRAVYSGPEQGLRGIRREFTLAEDIDTKKVRFEVGDAMAVDPALGTFDGLLAANLVCRVPDPRAMLRSFARLVNPGGILVLVSPYSWWDGATPKENWIGGTPGSERSEHQVQRLLESVGFEKLDEADEPFLIRDHHRRFQLGFSSCTVWRRKRDTAGGKH